MFRGPKTHPKSRNTKKTARLRELFRKVRANFRLLPCEASQEPNGNCSKKLVQMSFSILGGFFRVDFPPLNVFHSTFFCASFFPFFFFAPCPPRPSPANFLPQNPSFWDPLSLLFLAEKEVPTCKGLGFGDGSGRGRPTGKRMENPFSGAQKKKKGVFAEKGARFRGKWGLAPPPLVV